MSCRTEGGISVRPSERTNVRPVPRGSPFNFLVFLFIFLLFFSFLSFLFSFFPYFRQFPVIAIADEEKDFGFEGYFGVDGVDAAPLVLVPDLLVARLLLPRQGDFPLPLAHGEMTKFRR